MWVIRFVVVLLVLVAIGHAYDITLLEWLKLLIVPAVIAGGGIWFNRQQRERELDIARKQREQELDIVERRAQDETLRAYVDQMSGMLIPTADQPSLYKARPGDSLSSVARARTLTVLSKLDRERKARVVQFLYESGLISEGRRVIDLSGADLYEAILSVAGLSGAILREADLSGATLHGADLREADLAQAAVTEGQIAEARTLEGARMPNGQKYEDWLKDKKAHEDGKNE